MTINNLRYAKYSRNKIVLKIIPAAMIRLDKLTLTFRFELVDHATAQLKRYSKGVLICFSVRIVNQKPGTRQICATYKI